MSTLAQLNLAAATNNDVYTVGGTASMTININLVNSGATAATSVKIYVAASGSPLASELVDDVYLSQPGVAVNANGFEHTGLAVSTGKHIVIVPDIAGVVAYIGGY